MLKSYRKRFQAWYERLSAIVGFSLGRAPPGLDSSAVETFKWLVGACGNCLKKTLHAQEFSLEGCYLLASEKSWGGKYYSARSFECWCAAYKQFGFKGLMPKARNDCGQARALDEALKEQIVRLRKQDPNLTVKGLLEELYRREILVPGAPPSAATIYRFLHEVKLDNRSLRAGVLSGPTKAFEHAF